MASENQAQQLIDALQHSSQYGVWLEEDVRGMDARAKEIKRQAREAHDSRQRVHRILNDEVNSLMGDFKTAS